MAHCRLGRGMGEGCGGRGCGRRQFLCCTRSDGLHDVELHQPAVPASPTDRRWVQPFRTDEEHHCGRQLLGGGRGRNGVGRAAEGAKGGRVGRRWLRSRRAGQADRSDGSPETAIGECGERHCQRGYDALAMGAVMSGWSAVTGDELEKDCAVCVSLGLVRIKQRAVNTTNHN